VHYPVTIRDEKLFQETSMSNFNGAHAAMSETTASFGTEIRASSCFNRTMEAFMGRGILLWLLGVPIPIIILLFLFWH
jgi:hypothetical protein